MSQTFSQKNVKEELNIFTKKCEGWVKHFHKKKIKKEITSEYKTSSGTSMKTGPGTPDCEIWNASSTLGMISSTLAMCFTHLTCGRKRANWSISWSDPRPFNMSLVAPPMRITGVWAIWQFLTEVIVFVKPGPAVTFFVFFFQYYFSVFWKKLFSMAYYCNSWDSGASCHRICSENCVSFVTNIDDFDASLQFEQWLNNVFENMIMFTWLHPTKMGATCPPINPKIKFTPWFLKACANNLPPCVDSFTMSVERGWKSGLDISFTA